jgi:hypothetical protein
LGSHSLRAARVLWQPNSFAQLSIWGQVLLLTWSSGGIIFLKWTGCFKVGVAGFMGPVVVGQGAVASPKATQQAFAADGASEVFIEVGFATLGKPLGGVCVAAAEMRR